MGSATAQPAFDALDACHQQIQAHLQSLSDLAKTVADRGIDDQVRQQAETIEAFFSGTSRQHHAQEEASVFPELLASGNADLAAAAPCRAAARPATVAACAADELLRKPIRRRQSNVVR